MSWTASSWQSRPAAQQPAYPDQQALQDVLDQIGALPSLVTVPEVHRLRTSLAAAERGEVFVLQGGDCAESFADCGAERLTNQLKVLLQMSLLLVHGREQAVLRIGRIAGQYAKPRSAEYEEQAGLRLPSYRGDNVNAQPFDAQSREPDPQRLLQGHYLSALALNHLRGLIDGGFADLHQAEFWNFDWLADSPHAVEYRQRVASVRDSIRFMERLTHAPGHGLDRIDFYSSHEALLLPYEQALLRTSGDHVYDLSTHLPWIGVRTAALDGAHVEFFRGLANPIGVKIGPQMDSNCVVELSRALNPDNAPGKLVFIHRMGADAVTEKLPPLIEALKNQQRKALWICDPMHGNTELAPSGYKTRRFSRIVEELQHSFAVHREMGSHLGGVHLELTGENVTECLGGARDLQDSDLQRAYTSRVDPRLNAEQALELALKLVQM